MATHVHTFAWQQHYSKLELEHIPAKQYLVIHPYSETILAAKDIHTQQDPASLTKLMSLLIALEQIQAGNIHTDDLVHVSHKAWKAPGSRMFLNVNSKVKLSKILEGITVASGNDATIALAEHIAGNEATFVEMMNNKAKELKMHETQFKNSSGLPEKGHVSSAHDLGLLSSHFIKNHAYYLPKMQKKWIQYNNIKQNNRNRLLWHDPSITGMKTGHTNSAGYCLVASVNRNQQPLIAITLGSMNEQTRDQSARTLLNHASGHYVHSSIHSDPELGQSILWYGKQKQVQPQLAKPIHLSLPKINSGYQKKVELQRDLFAPIKAGQVIGSYKIIHNNKIIGQTELISRKAIATSGWWQQLLDWISYKSICVLRTIKHYV